MAQVRKQPLQQPLLRYINIGGGHGEKSVSASSLAGSDVPSLNAVINNAAIKIVTYRGSEDDIEVIGLRMAGRF